MDLYSASSRLLLRSASDSSAAKKSSFKARVECVKVNPGEHRSANGSPFQIEVIPPRMHEPGELKYGQKGQRV